MLDLILPPRCAGCGRAGAQVCPACAGLLRGEPRSLLPENPPYGLPDCWSGADYTGTVRRLLIAHKEHGRVVLAAALGACLAGTVVAALGEPGSPFLVVPVPSARAATRRRGHDPVRRMTVVAVAELRASGWPVAFAPVLRQRRRVADQAGLSAPERAANLAGGFMVAPAGIRPPACSSAVLIDDVVTTGATLAAAAAALRGAGVRVSLAVTVAATRKRVTATRHARVIKVSGRD